MLLLLLILSLMKPCKAEDATSSDEDVELYESTSEEEKGAVGSKLDQRQTYRLRSLWRDTARAKAAEGDAEEGGLAEQRYLGLNLALLEACKVLIDSCYLLFSASSQLLIASPC